MPRDDLPQEARKAVGLTGTQQEAALSDTILNPRREAFCQHFVLSGNATGAAVAAGYAPGSARNQGYRLMQQSDIRGRIGGIRRSLARAYCLDAEVLLGKLEAVYQRANENHSFNAAARAVELQARIAGHVTSRGARGENGRRPDREINKTTDDDIAAPAESQSLSDPTPLAIAAAPE